MKAALLRSSARMLSIEDVPRPTPATGYVLLKVLACGVCRTDLHVTEGDLPTHRAGVTPGHEVVAEVAIWEADSVVAVMWAAVSGAVMSVKAVAASLADLVAQVWLGRVSAVPPLLRITAGHTASSTTVEVSLMNGGSSTTGVLSATLVSGPAGTITTTGAATATHITDTTTPIPILTIVTNHRIRSDAIGGCAQHRERSSAAFAGLFL